MPEALVEPSRLPKYRICQLAEGFGEKLGYAEFPLDVEDLVRSIGGTIKYVDIWSIHKGASGSLEIFGIGDFVIYLPSDTSQVHDRFTLAHEVGHYVLHYFHLIKDKGESLNHATAARFGTGRIEWEANWFAASLLMPEPEYRRVYHEFDDINAVAKHFCVSVKAAQIRAKVLGLETQ